MLAVNRMTIHSTLCCTIGTVPSSLCGIATLTLIHISNSGNSLVTCAPLCLTTVTDSNLPSTVLETCPSAQDDALCGFIAATNIESISTHTLWSCTSDGLTSADPCSPVWSDITCSGSSVVNLDLNTISLTGMIDLIH